MEILAILKVYMGTQEIFPNFKWQIQSLKLMYFVIDAITCQIYKYLSSFGIKSSGQKRMKMNVLKLT